MPKITAHQVTLAARSLRTQQRIDTPTPQDARQPMFHPEQSPQNQHHHDWRCHRLSSDIPLEARSFEVLLRKEVIQPHLPVRLPCYDFVLIASPTFDGSLHKG